MAPPAVSLFDLLKFLPLFVGKIDRDLLVRFRHDRMDAPSSVAPYLLKLRSRLISRTAANVEIAITAADNSATRRSSDAMPFVRAVPRLWDQTATTRVSNPNGISAGASSPACAADRNNRSIS